MVRTGLVRVLGIVAVAAFFGCGGSGSDSQDGGAGDAASAPVDATVFDAPPIVTPDEPGTADVRFDVHSQQEVRSISRFIYGHNSPDWDGRGGRLTLGRSGGNRLTAYNWENNASNAGEDYFNQNDSYLGGGDTPGEVARSAVAAAHAHGASQIVTVPIQGYVAADKGPGGDVNMTPDYLANRFKVSLPTKGSAFSTTPDTSDGFVYQDEFVSFLEGAFPSARTDPARTIFYCLDNEPDLWSSTHPRIHPDPVRYDELVQRNREYAAAIKAVVPSALVFGFVSYGWNGYVTLQDAPDAAGRDFIDHYLAEMAAAGAAAGRRLVDVLDLHWYPEAQGGGVRVTADDASGPVAQARMQAPRSLWDPTYTEDSWITQFSTGGPIALLPRMRDKIATNYPGTRLAITEYYYGGGDHISGGIAQADVLGIFGREQVFAATLWHLGGTDDRFIWGAFDMYRDLDGAGAGFGDTSISATTDDVAQTSVYASVDAAAPDRVVLIVINKSSGALDAGIAVSHHVRLGTAEVFQLTAANPSPTRAADITLTATNALVYSMPAMSVSALVLRP
jgi:hypothetical protein